MSRRFLSSKACAICCFLAIAGCTGGDDDDSEPGLGSAADGGDYDNAASGGQAAVAGGTGGSSPSGQEQEPPWTPAELGAGEGGAAGGAGSMASSGGTGGAGSGGWSAPSAGMGGSYAQDGGSSTFAAADAGAEVEGDTDPSNQGDSYEPPGTNPFVKTAHDPFSTFAADVDTASYDIFRRDIGYGTLPQPNSVRLEEYVNYFSYNYPAPSETDEHPFSISLAAAPHIFDRGTRLLRVGIQGQLPPAFEKKPTNLVFLVDVSGSMGDADKLPLVKEVLTKTLDVLEPDDTISIVTYASSTGVRLEPTPVSQRAAILDVVNGLTSGGSTYGEGGLHLAYAQAEAGFIEGGINHVLLCTDGDFNVGVSGTDELVQIIEQKRDTGITLTVLGFGTGNLNDAMMEAISNAGNGVYGVISSSEHASRYVEDRMLSTVHHIAKDMKIQVEFNPLEVYAYRLLGYENRAIADEDFRDDTVDAGEVGAGHRVTALYELVMVGGEIPQSPEAPDVLDGESVDGDREIDPNDMVLVKVRYKDVDAAEGDPAQEVSETLTVDGIAASHADADDDFQWAVAIASFAEILKDSPYADPDSIGAIEDIVTAQSDRDGDRAEFADLFQEAKLLLP